MQPKDRLPEVLAAADVHVVPLQTRAGPVERAVEAVLDPGRRPAAGGERRPGHRGGADRRAGRRRARGAARRSRGVHQGVIRLLDAPGRSGGHGRGRAPVRGALGVAGCRGRGVRGAVRRAPRRPPVRLAVTDRRRPTGNLVAHGQRILGPQGRTRRRIERWHARAKQRNLALPGGHRAHRGRRLAPRDLRPQQQPVGLGQQHAPRASIDPAKPSDHWHAAFAVDICGKEQPPVQDGPVDKLGIHTHGDGVIHIHPFVTRAAGKGANLGRFFTQVGMKVTDSVDPDAGQEDLRGGQDHLQRQARRGVRGLLEGRAEGGRRRSPTRCTRATSAASGSARTTRPSPWPSCRRARPSIGPERRRRTSWQLGAR